MSELLCVESMKKHYPVRKGFILRKETGVVKAVDDVSFTVRKGETLGLIGESGCGKSTLSQVLMGITPPTGGTVRFNGEIVDNGKMKSFRKKAQMIFQDPYSSLNPRQSIRRIIEEPLRIHETLSAARKRERVSAVIDKLGIPDESLRKYPHEFSGGQRQRIGIARALVLEPEFVICDEPVSALDVSVQSQILNLFMELQQNSGLTYLFISHDMSVVKHVSSRIAVMYMGKIVELCDKNRLFSDTRHPYSMALISAIPVPSPAGKTGGDILSGDIPDPMNPPSGCAFRTRCRHTIKQCAEDTPVLREILPGHYAACHLCAGNAVTEDSK